ncbi:hypothetical protein BDW75DRAFT_206616 [Aspergillus navahoensis]
MHLLSSWRDFPQLSGSLLLGAELVLAQVPSRTIRGREIMVFPQDHTCQRSSASASGSGCCLMTIFHVHVNR